MNEKQKNQHHFYYLFLFYIVYLRAVENFPHQFYLLL